MEENTAGVHIPEDSLYLPFSTELWNDRDILWVNTTWDLRGLIMVAKPSHHMENTPVIAVVRRTYSHREPHWSLPNLSDSTSGTKSWTHPSVNTHPSSAARYCWFHSQYFRSPVHKGHMELLTEKVGGKNCLTASPYFTCWWPDNFSARTSVGAVMTKLKACKCRPGTGVQHSITPTGLARLLHSER